MSKPPTPQGISVLLRKAGFEKSVVTRNTRHHKAHTAGYHVTTIMGEVRVNWWPETDDSAAAHQAAIPKGREMRARYADVIAAAGWAVTEKMHTLIVTAKPETPAGDADG